MLQKSPDKRHHRQRHGAPPVAIGFFISENNFVLLKFYDPAVGNSHLKHVGGALVGSEKCAQLLWYGKRDQEVMSGQLPIKLFIEPLSGVMALADIAMTVAAGAEAHVHLAASATVANHQAGISAPAFDNGANGLDVVFRHAIPVLMKILGRILRKNLLHIDHDGTSGIRSLMIPQACSWP